MLGRQRNAPALVLETQNLASKTSASCSSVTNDMGPQELWCKHLDTALLCEGAGCKDDLICDGVRAPFQQWELGSSRLIAQIPVPCNCNVMSSRLNSAIFLQRAKQYQHWVGTTKPLLHVGPLWESLAVSPHWWGSQSEAEDPIIVSYPAQSN